MKATILSSIAALALPPCVHAQACTGDIAVNGGVDGGDLSVLLANWGQVTSTALSHACDVDGNGRVDGADLATLLSSWGACPAGTWCTVIDFRPDPAVVGEPSLRTAIAATGHPWRVWDRNTGIEMLLVPPGAFQMGCIMGSDQWPECALGEEQAHTETVAQSFYLGRFEVSESQWTGTMGRNPSQFRGLPNAADRPVESVSMNAVVGFLARTDLRLPTAPEWEFACRAGTTAPFFNGSTDESTLVSLAWYSADTWETAIPGYKPFPVGLKQPNGFGFFDMLGNVWEWTSGWDGEVRGGCYDSSALGVRSSSRAWYPPGLADCHVGFRVARNP